MKNNSHNAHNDHMPHRGSRSGETAVIVSPHNPRVKAWVGLLEKKKRNRSGLYIIEGAHLVLEALLHGALLETIVYEQEGGLPRELERLVQPKAITLPGNNNELVNNEPGNIELVAASAQVMAKCTETDTPPPVFAVVRKQQQPVENLFAPDALVVVLDGVRDPGNVGTIIRSADAAGATAVVLGDGCVDLYNPKTIRSTMGSLFHLPIVEQASLPTLLAEARGRGMRLVGTLLQATRSCYNVDLTMPTWLLFGNESEGLSAEVSVLLEEGVRIPMRGKAESLNVAMAATILLYEAVRQRN